MQLSFTVYGPPVGKQRPRVTKRGTFTPKATRDYEKSVKQAFVVSFELSRMREWDMMLQYRFECAIYFPDARRRDIENVGKAIADGLNGAAYGDDSQIADYHLMKFIDRENPRVDITVTALEAT